MARETFREDLPTFTDEYEGVKARQLVDSLSRYFRRSQRRPRKITRIDTSTASYDVDGNDEVVLADRTSAGALAIIFPDAELWQGLSLVIHDSGNNAAVNNITATRSGTNQINGANTYVINVNRRTVSFGSDGSNWFVEAIA